MDNNNNPKETQRAIDFMALVKACPLETLPIIELVFSEGRTFRADLNLLSSLGQLEGDLGAFLLKVGSSLHQAGKLADEEKRGFICGFFDSLFSLFGKTGTLLDKKTECEKLLSGEKVEELRTVIYGVLKDQKMQIVKNEIKSEEFSMGTSLITLALNINHIFSGLENVQTKNNESKIKYERKLQRIKKRFETAENEYKDGAKINVEKGVTELPIIVEELMDLISDIDKVCNEQKSHRFGYIGGTLVSVARFGFAVGRAIILKEYLSLGDKLVLGASAAVHVAAGSTNVYLAFKYHDEFKKFQSLVESVQALKINLDELSKEIKMEKKKN